MTWTRHAMITVALAAAGITSSCGGSAPGTQPDDMSAEEHRSAAEAHEGESGEHAAQYDPDAEQVRAGATTVQGDFDYGQDVYNPTDAHLQSAEGHQEIAEEHRAAAATLEAYEDAQCGRFPPETRARCPLLGQVERVEDIEGGARIQFTEDVNVEAAREHVQCHVAFARTEGREGMSQCPMYLEGVTAATDGPAGTVDLATEDASQVDELRRRARAHVGP